MITKSSKQESAPIEFEDILSLMELACKPSKEAKIGIEYERFAFYKKNYAPVSYEGKKGLGALLDKIQKEWRWRPILDSNHLIGLVHSENGCTISLEPGGQFEFSGSPLRSVHEIEKETKHYLKEIESIASSFGIGFLALGAHPSFAEKDIPRMPKSRYRIMEQYMPKVGACGLDMMFRTCTIHANLDFFSQTDMRRKMQVALKLQPLVSALFAHSPFTEGMLNSMQSWRCFIWQDTDQKRCALPERFYSSSFGFADYVEWALDIPMYFIIRDNVYYDATAFSFRDFMHGALEGKVPDALPTKKDWENHLSTLFPEVRLKNCIEIRGADSGSPKKIFALASLWAGLFLAPHALDAIESLTCDWTFDAIQESKKNMPFQGLLTQLEKRCFRSIARDVLSIAYEGLKEREYIGPYGHDETSFLDPLYEIIESGKTEAEHLTDLFNQEWDKKIEPIYSYAVS